jgi:hypothetical protein
MMLLTCEHHFSLRLDGLVCVRARVRESMAVAKCSRISDRTHTNWSRLQFTCVCVCVCVSLSMLQSSRCDISINL